jgi:hypothetical protein
LPDILVYTAGLASNTHAVDPILDDFRMVTSSHAIGAPFDATEQQRLANAYLKLEDYLARQERVRPVSNDELRGKVQGRFGGVLAQNSIFAQIIGGATPTVAPPTAPTPVSTVQLT